MFSLMAFCKKNQSIGFPFGSLITKILASVVVDLMDEPVDTIHSQNNSLSLSKIKFLFFQVELSNDHMVEDEEEAQSIAAKDEVINFILTMTHQNTLFIQKLGKDVVIIKKKTLGKSIIKDDINSDN